MNEVKHRSWKLSGSPFAWQHRSFRTLRKAVVDNQRVGVLVVTHTLTYLEECLDSIVAQSRKADRVIVVSNGSQDADLIEALTLSRNFEFVKIKDPAPPANARNVACHLLDDCAYLTNLDGDDIWEPDYLETYLGVAMLAKADVVYGPALLFGNEQGVAFTWKRTGNRDNLRVKNYVPANSVFRRSVWQSVGGYDSSVGLYGDYEFWMHAARAGARFAYVDSVLWKYRRHSTSQVQMTPEQQRQNSHVLIRQKHIRYINGALQWRRAIRGLVRLQQFLLKSR